MGDVIEVVVALDFMGILRERITPRTYRYTPAAMFLKVLHVCPLGATVYSSKQFTLHYVLPPQDSLYYYAHTFHLEISVVM
jgi:hypothetical protein